MKFFTLSATLLLSAVSISAAIPLQEAVCRDNSRFSNLQVEWPKPRKSSRQDDQMRLIPQRNIENRQLRSAAKAVEGGIGVYGYVSESDFWDFVPKWVELTSSGYEEIWQDSDYWTQGEVKLDSGWIRDGKLCGYASQILFGQQLVGYYYKEFDLATGTSTKCEEIDYDANNILYTAAYDPHSDTIFGFGIDVEGNPCLLSAPGANPTNVTIEKALINERSSMLFSITWNEAEKMFVGVNYNNELVSVTKDGADEVLMSSTGVSDYIPYYTGLCYDATARKYYWNVFDDVYGYIYRLDVEEGAAEKVSTINDCEGFAMLYCPSKIVSPTAPDRPSLGAFDFVGASLSGSVSFVLPDVRSDGSELTGALNWTATLDGNMVETGVSSAGATVKVVLESLTTGMHSFGCYATIADTNEEGPEFLFERYLGNDTPSAPTGVKLSAVKVEWDKVTTGIHDGYVDSEQIVYNVTLDGKAVGSTSDTSLDITIDDTEQISAHIATVSATFDGRTSAESSSNKFVYGHALELPVSFAPTEEQFAIMSTSDGDGDGQGWHYVGDKLDADSPCLDSDYSNNPDKKADDWLFLPPINFPNKDAYYTLAFEAKGRLVQMSPEEYFEVRIGSSPDASAMTQVIMPETKCRAGFTDYERYFRVPSDGTYYIAFHAVSAPMMFGVRIRSIDVEISDIVANSPVAPTDLSAIPAPLGELSAKVSFTLPVKNVMDGTIDNTHTLTAKIEGAETVTITGRPGESVTTDVPTRQGDNRLRISVADGDAPGLPTELKVYTGVDIPNPPSKLKGYVSEDNLDMIIEWEPSDTGEHDGYVDPSKVSYTVHTYTMMGWMPVEYLGEGVTTYKFIGEPSDGLGYLRLGVSARSIAGESSLLTATGCVVGSPYDLPLEETFDSAGGASIGPWTAVGSSDCQWGFADLRDISYDWDDLPGGAMVGMPGKAGISSGLVFPKFGTLDYPDSNILIRVWNGGGAPAKMSLYGTTFGLDEDVLLTSVTRANDWENIVVSIPEELKNRDWVQIKLVCDFTSKDQLCVVDYLNIEEGAAAPEITANLTQRIFATDGEIMLYGLQGKQISVSTIDGRNVANVIPAGQLSSIKVAPGLYIVNAGAESKKLLVK